MLFFFRTLLLFSLSLQVVHADFNDGRAAALVGDYNTAHAEWLPLAEQGHIDAQFYIGLLNSNQLIDQATQEQAVRWYLLAANNGHVELNRATLRLLIGTSKQLKVVIQKPSSIWLIRIEMAEVLRLIWKGQ